MVAITVSPPIAWKQIEIFQQLNGDYQVERKTLQSIYLAKKDNSFPLIQNVTGEHQRMTTKRTSGQQRSHCVPHTTIRIGRCRIYSAVSVVVDKRK